MLRTRSVAPQKMLRASSVAPPQSTYGSEAGGDSPSTEAFLLMFNEVAELRKEIKVLRGSKTVARGEKPPDVSPWTKDGNLYNPLLNPHREGLNEEEGTAIMGPMAQAFLSKPDLDQFTRDAIYMLHREVLQLRQSVASCELHSSQDPLTAAMERADAARKHADDVRKELADVRKWAESTHDVLKNKTNDIAADLRAGLRKVRHDIANESHGALASQIAQVAAENAAFESSISARVESNREAVLRYDTQIRDAASIASQLSHASEGISRRVDFLEHEAIGRARNRTSKDEHDGLVQKFAYHFDFAAPVKIDEVARPPPAGGPRARPASAGRSVNRPALIAEGGAAEGGGASGGSQSARRPYERPPVGGGAKPGRQRPVGCSRAVI
ncbi:hypothetical protein T484DRAFT_1880661 [Baffinella frigidus]|nr:hypothetical protein T484DRAFT_1880661 [Cryptophyta sp. CCMP2293]